MTVLKLNEKGIFLLTGILTILIVTLLININISFMTILIVTPLLTGINLIITSNLKIIAKKEPVPSFAKMKN